MSQSQQQNLTDDPVSTAFSNLVEVLATNLPATSHANQIINIVQGVAALATLVLSQHHASNVGGVPLDAA